MPNTLFTEVRPSRVDDVWEVAASRDFVGLLRRSAQLAQSAGRSSRPLEMLARLSLATDESDLHALVAIESIAAIDHPGAGEHLGDMLGHPSAVIRRHAAWRLGDHAPVARAVRPLVRQLSVGGIDTMHAHRTLRRWSASGLTTIANTITAALADAVEPAVRARLIDALGVLDDRETETLLIEVATDPFEASAARAAAIGALGDRIAEPVGVALLDLATSDDEFGSHAALALRSTSTTPPPLAGGRPGMRVAQLVLADGLDGQLSLGGRGETGGVASLLVSLGEALARRDDVDHVLTIGRGSVTDALAGPMTSNDLPLAYGTIAIGDDARHADGASGIWEHLPAVERGVRRMLRLTAPVDVLHLRMADVGTLAGAEVARAMGVPICFSLAADPHNVVQSLQSRGELDARSFVELERTSHVWFRARLVERLGRDADRVALFPRAKTSAFPFDVGMHAGEHRVAEIAEGIDVGLVRQAVDRSNDLATGRRHDVVDLLADRIAPRRNGLPLLLSVGRLHPVKGMERIVAAWAADPRLYERCNLVIVGGALDQPSDTERGVLAAIDREIPIDDARRDGLVLLGGRPHRDVARLQATAAVGRPGSWSPGGIYVDGALKEEFGLAVLESLAAGLVVVAPSTGGPATYVDHGDTGMLVDPDDDLGAAIRAAFELVDRPGRSQRALDMVQGRYSIDTMAADLADLYRPVAALL